MAQTTKRIRAQAIIIRNGEMLFEYGESADRSWRFLLGGGINENESPEIAVIREVKEEAGVDGKIIFRLSREVRDNHITFLINIGDSRCKIGSDPEYESNNQHLQQLVWISLSDRENFSDMELRYLKYLYLDCITNQYNPSWLKQIAALLGYK